MEDTMRVLFLTLKDISQVARDRRSLFFLILMPIAFTLFMGFAYRSGSAPADTRLALGWVDADPEGFVTAELRAVVLANPEIRLVEIDPAGLDPALEKVRKGDLAGILVIPPGFTTAAVDGTPAQLELFTDETTASGQALFQMLRVPVTRLMGAVEIAHQSTAGLNSTDEIARLSFTGAFIRAAQAWNDYASAGVKVTLQKSEIPAAGAPFGGNPYNQSSPGILTMFGLFGLVSSANILVQERRDHTLQRMLSTSLTSAQIIAGHLLANFVICFATTLLLLVFGQIALKVNYLAQPLAVLVISVVLCLWIAATGLAISVFAENDSQVVVYALICMFVYSALGGLWFPLDVSGAGFAAVGRVMPTTWVMTGYQNILLRGLGLSSVWLPAAIVLVYAATFFTLAVWRFSRRANQ
jgi:ABC-2 type transport system permease protein